jgi:pyrimidine deaminase RibD-like protein
MKERLGAPKTFTAESRRTARRGQNGIAVGSFSPETKAAFMAEALAESRKALPGCRPNPPVGCVIVDDRRIVARGFTGLPGQPHAEAAAIAALPHRADAARLAAFVTLEPCAFAGRTPSCARAIVARGIGAVFVGIIDPDPRNSGKGLQLLRDGGIVVELGILEEEIRAFLNPYLNGG